MKVKIHVSAQLRTLLALIIYFNECSYINIQVNKVREVLFSSKFLEETTKAQNAHFLFMNPA